MRNSIAQRLDARTLAACALLALACAHPQQQRDRPADAAPPVRPNPAATASGNGHAADLGATDAGAPIAPAGAARPEPKAKDASTATVPEPEPQLVSLDVEGDRPVYVAHANASITRAIVYLHGVCGDVFAVRSWLGAATRFGTLVAPLGDKPCPGGKRFKWAGSTADLQSRIERALAAVKTARGGNLDVEQPILFGYSQGASRAEFLVERYPARYSLLVLGGAPLQPSTARLRSARHIALLGGEREPRAHMERGLAELRRAERSVRLFVLPGAGHGEYGTDAARVLSEVFEWLLVSATPAPL